MAANRKDVSPHRSYEPRDSGPCLAVHSSLGSTKCLSLCVTTSSSFLGGKKTKSCWKKQPQIQSKIIVYDLFEEWGNNNDLCVKDLQHLVDLLAQTRLTTNVLDRIPLNKVARAQELVESIQVSGFMVCEPWIIGKCRAVCL